jgi:hypothetical protein
VLSWFYAQDRAAYSLAYTYVEDPSVPEAVFELAERAIRMEKGTVAVAVF